jgi:DNA adenine methylase
VGYPGAKSVSGAWQTIINLMPPHDVYIEPFVGSGAVLARKRPARLNIGVDLERAALELTRGAAAAGGLTSVEFRPLAIASSADPAGGASCELRLVCGDGIEFLERYPWTGREVVYCDPPYLLSTRRSARRLYKHEMDLPEHRRFLRVLRSVGARVIVSGYSSSLYAGELRGWNAISFRAGTRGGDAAEWLWFNFPRPVELHDYRFLGSDFRERERIRRKQRRWSARLAAMDAIERQALISVLAESGVLNR